MKVKQNIYGFSNGITRLRYLFLLLYIGFVLLIFFGLPDEILYSQNIIRWLPFVLIFFVQPFLLYHLLKLFNVVPKYLLGAAALSVLVIGPSLGFYLNYRDESDFKHKGQTTKGVVYKKWYSSKKSSHEWLLKCRYVVDGVVYSTFSETDKDNEYEVGDSLTIVYINDFPQKCKIKELE